LLEIEDNIIMRFQFIRHYLLILFLYFSIGLNFMRQRWFLPKLMFFYIFSLPAFAGFWCTGSSTSIYCSPLTRPGYWCMGTETGKYCQPTGESGFWCLGSSTSLYCHPYNKPGYWCMGSETSYYCDGD